MILSFMAAARQADFCGSSVGFYGFAVALLLRVGRCLPRTVREDKEPLPCQAGFWAKNMF